MGTLGSLFVVINGKIVEWKKHLVNKYPTPFANFFFYSALVSVLVGCLTYPGLIGQFSLPVSLFIFLAMSVSSFISRNLVLNNVFDLLLLLTSFQRRFGKPSQPSISIPIASFS
jgi:hypothetical protein